MNLVVLLVVIFLLWLGYMLYKAYSGIIDELKQIREKCVSSTKETFKTTLNEKPIENELEKIPGSMVKGLTTILKMMA